MFGPITFLLLINFAVFDGSYHLRMLSQLFQLFHFLMRKRVNDDVSKDYGYTVHRDPSFV